MKLGTKSLLFGGHQFLIHPLLVLIAWVKLYRSFPSWRELICIFIHDWGYWGVADIKGERGDRHPECGGRIALKLFGPEWQNFILGHSSFYITRMGLERSKLLAPDKYWHCMIPFWLYKALTIHTGEFKYYRTLQHARQVTALDVTDEQWWAEIQKVCAQKVKGTFVIDKTKLAK